MEAKSCMRFLRCASLNKSNSWIRKSLILIGFPTQCIKNTGQLNFLFDLNILHIIISYLLTLETRIFQNLLRLIVPPFLCMLIIASMLLLIYLLHSLTVHPSNYCLTWFDCTTKTRTTKTQVLHTDEHSYRSLFLLSELYLYTGLKISLSVLIRSKLN